MSNPEGHQDGIAIIGMAGRFPKAKDIEQFWRNLQAGVEAISFFSEEELEAEGINFPKNNPDYVKARGMLEEADHFDAAFFGINPREAEIMDPQHRVFLECAWEALEHAGYDSERCDGLVGVFAGMSMNTYLLSNLASHPELLERLGHYQVMLANDKDFLSTRVSYRLNLKGPSISIQTACSTSLVAVCVACQNLLNFQCDLALAGGVSIIFPQKCGQVYQQGGIVSPDGHCRAFDARAQGTVPGEGAGVVVLKRATEAVADGDQIYAIIKGFGLNNDGSLKMGFTAPSEEGQAEVIAQAHAVAGFEPETIGYVVAHGTGTPLGDPIEVAALTKAFQAGTSAHAFCALTSVKSNIGHLDAAAGVAGLINAALALHHKSIPSSLHFEKPNPKIDFANSPFYVNARTIEWKAGSTPRRAGVSSFGIGGTNAHVVLEEAPRIATSENTHSTQLLVLSAKTARSLEMATAKLAAHLKANPELNLGNAAYTLQLGRRGFPFRRMLVCSDATQAADALEPIDPTRVFSKELNGENLPVVFMFPGQGAQYVNMGAELYQSEPAFREQIDLCAEILRPLLGLDLRDVLYPSREKTDEAKAQLNQTLFTQPAIFAIDYAVAKLWMSWGVQPQAMIGHSVGEFVAACLAGVLSLKDALHLVAKRAQLVQQQPGGAMLAVRMAEREVQPLLNGKLSLAAVNSPAVSVVSGPEEAVDTLQHQLRDRGVASQRLLTSHAFHSSMMEPVLGPLNELLKRTTLKEPRIPYISNLSATWIKPEEALDPTYWSRHMRHTVRFAPGIEELLKNHQSILLEAGPGQTLSLLARQCPAKENQPLILSSLPAPQSRQNDRAVMLQSLGQLWLSGTPIDWKAFSAKGGHRRVPLPTYCFDRKRYWIAPAKAPQTPAIDSTALLTNGVARPDLPGEISVAPIHSSGPQPSSRKETILSTLQSLLSELSGLRPEQIARSKTFMEMGFDSLFLTQASQTIQQRLGVRVAFGDLLEKFSTIELLGDYLDQVISSSTHGQIPASKAPEAAVASDPGAVRIGAAGEFKGVLTVPLTEAQKELWYSTLLGDKASCVFNESIALQLKGRLNLKALRQAVQDLVNRHEALRTAISSGGDDQQIFPTLPIEVPLTRLDALQLQERETKFQALLRAAASQAFELSKPPLLRCQVVRMSEECHYLIIVIHHIICDGGSVLVLLQDLAELYSACAQGEEPTTVPPVQFSEYACAHARNRGSAARQADEDYWLGQFPSPAAPLELPADRPRPAKLDFNAACTGKQLPGTLWQELKRLSGQNNCTAFTTLLAAYYVLLHRLTGQSDLVVGVPMVVREGIERLVGHCVNFLPLRSQITVNPKFTDYLCQVRKIFFEAFDHQNYTFGSLIQKLNPPRDSSRMPLLSATFNFVRGGSELEMAGLETELIPNPTRFSNFDITFDVVEKDGDLECNCTYNTDLFNESTIQRWLNHFQTLLEEIAANPSRPIGELSLLALDERRQIVQEWNQTHAEYPQVCLHQLFESQVERRPNGPALRFNGQIFTYQQLNARANQIAHYLRGLGVGPEECVAVQSFKSFETIAALMGILKAGGAFVPLDPTDPKERVRFILQDSKARVLLTDQRLAENLPRHNAKVISLHLADLWRNEGTVAPKSAVQPGNLACLTYVSGIAGFPVGTLIEHRNLVALVKSVEKEFEAEELAGVLASNPLCSNMGLVEILVPLCQGGTVVLLQEFQQVSDLVSEQEVRVVNAVPSALSQFLESWSLPSSVRTIHLFGEPLPETLLQRLNEQNKKVCFVYGPPEDAGVTTSTQCHSQSPGTIGRPAANKQVYLLDQYLQPVPIGVPGELYIGGAGIARGYLNQPELTANRFLPNPFSNDRAARLYRTGDRARYRADGNIELLAPLDQHFTIRGWRVGPLEIEAALAEHLQVRQCAATTRQNENEAQQSVAFVVLHNGQSVTATELQNFLSEKLPPYMVPDHFVFVESLPMLPSGTVDRSRLPAVSKESPQQENHEPSAMSETESILAEIWREVIGLEKVGLNENFFELGGHSVLVTQILSRVRKMFGVDLTLRTVFEAPTIAELALEVEKALTEPNGESPGPERPTISRSGELLIKDAR